MYLASRSYGSARCALTSGIRNNVGTRRALNLASWSDGGARCVLNWASRNDGARGLLDGVGLDAGGVLATGVLDAFVGGSFGEFGAWRWIFSRNPLLLTPLLLTGGLAVLARPGPNRASFLRLQKATRKMHFQIGTISMV